MPFGVLLSIDIVVSIKIPLTETTMSIDYKMPNGLSLTAESTRLETTDVILGHLYCFCNAYSYFDAAVAQHCYTGERVMQFKSL